MNNTDSEKRGHVIPKWLDPMKSISKGETQVPRKNPFSINKATKNGIKEELSTFRGNPTLKSACYLLGAAVLIGDEGLSHESARFIRGYAGVDEPITELADNILGIQHVDFSPLHINLQIAKMKAWVREFSKSAIAWIELGRLYTIQGQKEKARNAVITALSLAPYDRYIIRCGVRFFLHIFDYDAAWNYIRKANNNVRDPWLKATELNVAMISDKKTPNIEGFLYGDMRETDLFHYSELHESVGILELNAGNHKKAKKLFRTAWSDPSESVITHGEWIIRNKMPGLKDNSPLDYARSLEAQTWVQYYYQHDLATALNTAQLWQDEEPYSRSPFVLSACIAGNAGLHDEAVDFAKKGLRANPNDKKLLNSFCYELLRAGKIQDGREVFKKWEQVIDDRENDVFYLATAGLLMFKMKNAVEGRRLYLEAISKCKEQEYDHLIGKAYLNLAIAEIEAKIPEAMKTVLMAMELSNGNIHPDVHFLRQEVISKINMGKYRSDK